MASMAATCSVSSASHAVCTTVCLKHTSRPVHASFCPVGERRLQNVPGLTSFRNGHHTCGGRAATKGHEKLRAKRLVVLAGYDGTVASGALDSGDVRDGNGQARAAVSPADVATSSGPAVQLALAAATVAAAAVHALKNALVVAVSTAFAPQLLARQQVLAQFGRSSIAVAGPLFFAAVGQSAPTNTPLTVIASGMAKWLELYSGVLLIRVLLSWFPNIDWERQPMQAIRDMCDPYLNLFRNILPPVMGVLDLSPMLAFLVLGFLTSILNTTMYN